MIALKLRVKNTIDVTDYQRRYSGMFRYIYINRELCADKQFQKETQEKFGFDTWIYESCKNEVLTKLAQIETNNENKKSDLADLEAEFIVLEAVEKPTKKKRRRKYKVRNKIASLKKSIGRDITFGGRKTLQDISYLSNLKDRSKEEEARLVKAKKDYEEGRLLTYYSIGEAPQNGNRKFDFDLANKKAIFKPERGVKIPIEFYCSDGQHNWLWKLSVIGDIAITVRLTNDYICIIFDEEKLSGYAFDKNSFMREIKLIPKEDKEARKACGKKWAVEQDDRMFFCKNKRRFISVDLNPEYIGYAILEMVENEGKYKIIYADYINLSGLNTKLGLSSTDPNQIYQNNKRIHEIREAWKRIFVIAKHYKCAYFAVEKLGFDGEPVNDNASEANRKTKNLWHRTMTMQSITKHCHTMGIKIEEVPTYYSSFIGNIQHNYYDPVNAAIEIGRRGITKYMKGLYYPPLEVTDLDTMCALGLDVQRENVSTWVQAYKLFNTAELRYRREAIPSLGNNLGSHKSKVKLLHYL